MSALLLNLIIEKGDDGLLWGRVIHEEDLLVDSAQSATDLKRKLTDLLRTVRGVEAVEFSVSYDLTAFFEEYDFLKISKIAELAGMNPSLLRHYSRGTKNPSAEQVKRIEDAVHALASELSAIHLQAA